jgi:hypothetical protein
MTGDLSHAYRDRSTILTSYHLVVHIQEIARRSNENGGAQYSGIFDALSGNENVVCFWPAIKDEV